MKAKTIRLKEKDYATVPERIRLFRSANPFGKIETFPTFQDDGQLMFKAIAVKDMREKDTGTATGHSLGKNQEAKAFEKLETIAVGRALANLGYLASGEVASGEEMEEFLKVQEEKKANELLEATFKLEAVTSLEELKTVWVSFSPDMRDLLEKTKDILKKKYESQKV